MSSEVLLDSTRSSDYSEICQPKDGDYVDLAKIFFRILGRDELTKTEIDLFQHAIKYINPNISLFGRQFRSLTNRSGVPGATMLHVLAKKGRPISLVHILRDAGANFNVQEVSTRNTPLIWAIANGNFSMAKEIIRLAPKATDFNIKGRDNTALHLAIGKGYTTRTKDGVFLTVSSLDLVKELINKTDLNSRGCNGNTPLHIACIRRDWEIMQILLEKGADPSLRNDQGESVADLLNKTYEEAIQFLTKQAVVFLLDKSRFDASYEACLGVLKHQFTSEVQPEVQQNYSSCWIL